MKENYPVIYMNPSIFARLFFTVVTLFLLWLLLFWAPASHPGKPPEPHEAALLKSIGLLAGIISTAFFLLSQSFNMRMEFRPDKFVFVGFHTRNEIRTKDIDNAYYRGYNVLAAAANTALGALAGNRYAAQANPYFVDSPHLIFVLKSGQTVAIQIDSSVEKEAVAYLREMLATAGHPITGEAPAGMLPLMRSPPAPTNLYVR